MQGRALFDRGTEVMNREDRSDLRNRSGWRGSYYGSMGFTSSSSEVTVVDFEVPRMLKRDVLSNIIEQNLSGRVQPGDQRFSGGCVLVIGGRESEKGDPQDNVERFLRLVYGKKSNLNRFQPVSLQRSPQTLAVHAVRLV